MVRWNEREESCLPIFLFSGFVDFSVDLFDVEATAGFGSVLGLVAMAVADFAGIWVGFFAVGFVGISEVGGFAGTSAGFLTVVAAAGFLGFSVGFDAVVAATGFFGNSEGRRESSATRRNI